MTIRFESIEALGSFLCSSMPLRGILGMGHLNGGLDAGSTLEHTTSTDVRRSLRSHTKLCLTAESHPVICSSIRLRSCLSGLWWPNFLIEQSCKLFVGVRFNGAYWDYRDIPPSMVQDVEFIVTQPRMVSRPLKSRIDCVSFESDCVIAKLKIVF